MAIALVVLSHFTYSRGFPNLALPWWGSVFQGKLGVRIFFVISGFLITLLLLSEADKRGRPSLQAFFIRRILRIFPVYFLYAGVLGVLAWAGLYSDAASSWIGTLTFTRDLMGRGQSATVHFWSLGVEEKFYLAWPITFAALALWRRTNLALGLLMVPVLVNPLLRTGLIQQNINLGQAARLIGPSSIALFADSLAIGCMGAFFFHQRRERLAPFATGPLLGAALVILFAAAAWQEARLSALTEAMVPTIQAVTVMIALWVTVERRTGLLFHALNARPVAWLGTLSYSLYVWQQLFVSHFAGPRLGGLFFYDWRLWWLAALLTACTSYYLVEKPILGLKDRLLPREGA
ncbi:MAG: acyltransferase [Holophagaceae bacterium]|nr:acyltransferase [Holophagaceae bacterium]